MWAVNHKNWGFTNWSEYEGIAQQLEHFFGTPFGELIPPSMPQNKFIETTKAQVLE